MDVKNFSRISENYVRNKDKFVEGKHYFRLTGQEVLDFYSYTPGVRRNESITVLYLWTERGAILHAKILKTDKAWQADSYFHYRELSQVEQQQVKIKKYSLYVVLFDYGVIKIGKGVNAMTRVRDHAKQARIFGRKVINFFIEENPQVTEEDVIRFCNQHGTLYDGNEYFKDLDYDVVVRFVKRQVERKVLKLVR